MMKRKLIGALDDVIGKKVKICGWVHVIRNQKLMQFLIIRDHTGFVQAIHKRQSSNDIVAKTIDNLTIESAVTLTGNLIRNKQVKLRQIEIIIENLEVINPAASPLPIDEKTGLEGRLDWRFLDLRRPANYLIFRVQTIAESAMRRYWEKEEFIEIHSPKLMGSASESGSELFRVEYFDKYAYLAQSPQFYKQMAIAAGFDRVFEISPVFRANPSFTSRHDTEFTSVDVEIGWVDSHEDIMSFEECWLQFVLKVLKEKLGETISQTFNTEIRVPEIPFPRVTLEEAREILAKEKYPLPPEGDLDPEGERRIARYIQKHFDHEFVFITNYPIDVRPFYHMRYENKPNLTKSFDLIWKGLEITTGAQREHRYDILLEQAREKGVEIEPLQYYLNFFKHGCPPHGGFGFGLTRMLMVLLGLKNVREVTYLYRGPNRLSP